MKLNISVREALQWGIEKLKKAGVETPVLDAELFLAHSAIPRNRRIDRAWLHAHDREHLSTVTLEHFRRLVKRRAKREPVAYIVGHKEFYGLDFLVNKNVLIPRPETELIVEEVKKQINRYTLHGTRYMIVDVGTGSGAIAVAVAKECKIKNVKCKMIGTDISKTALDVAKKNARWHGVADRIKFLKGDLLEPILVHSRQFTVHRWIVAANLPYLPTSEWRVAMTEVRKYEPRGALDGGRDGLKYYREMFGQIECKMQNVKCKMTVLAEICPEQAAPFKKMARKFFPRAQFEVVKDLARRNRVVIVRI